MGEPVRRVSRGRGPISKRWIYWKRRFSNPTRRDWLLLVCLLWIAGATAVSFHDFRGAAMLLAACPLVLAVVRMLPRPWRDVWVNRRPMTDVLTMLVAAGSLAVLAVVVPS
ncbi:hypothetical protein [Brevibacterium samyangense]|uniref:DUF3017 domain-containing protein n=1 Tax=Brevibacterium samyangense TaxID=366888 RepID=A0ABN2TQQ6_9MICO